MIRPINEMLFQALDADIFKTFYKDYGNIPHLNYQQVYDIFSNHEINLSDVCNEIPIRYRVLDGVYTIIIPLKIKGNQTFLQAVAMPHNHIFTWQFMADLPGLYLYNYFGEK